MTILYPTASTTALDIIKGAMSILRVLAPDTALTAQEEADGLATLNEMLDSWSLNPLNLTREVNENVVTLAKSGNAPHTMGTGGDWNTARPVQIDGLTFALSGVYDKPIKLLQWDDYAAIRLKSLPVNYPQFAYVEYAYPLAKVYLYPVPASGLTLTVWSRKPLAVYPTTASAVSVPPGVVRAMKTNLALALAPQFQQTVDALTLANATNSLRQLQQQNVRIPTLATDPAVNPRRGSAYDIYSDGPRY